jgi:hypothetical protein
MLTYYLLLSKMASVDASYLLIFTCRFQQLCDYQKLVDTIALLAFLVSYWTNTVHMYVAPSGELGIVLGRK